MPFWRGFFSKHPQPAEIAKVKYRKSIKNTNSSLIRNKLKTFCFLILKDITFLKDINFTSKCYNSDPVVYQNKDAAREIQQQGLEKTSFKWVQPEKSSVKLYNICMLNVTWVFYIANYGDICFAISWIWNMSWIWTEIFINIGPYFVKVYS